MSEKVEGAKQDCGACKTKLVCVEIEEEWQGKVTKKLQWQNELDHKPHFRYVSPGKYNCVKPEAKAEEVLKQTKKTEFTVENLVTIDKEINKLIVIEEIVTKKLTTGDLPPNPAKVGMYMKFIYDKMNVEQ